MLLTVWDVLTRVLLFQTIAKMSREDISYSDIEQQCYQELEKLKLEEVIYKKECLKLSVILVFIVSKRCHTVCMLYR